MRRREFITLAGGAAAWPVVGRGQQGEHVRRLAMFINQAADDPEVLVRVATFAQGLQEFGWTIGRNVRIDYRWGGAGDAERIRKDILELLAIPPDVILTNSGLIVRTLQQINRSIPIVFVGVTDPIGAGLVASLARPGGNATGFIGNEYGISAKWLELLKQIAPHVTRVAVLRDPTAAGGGGQLGAIYAVAPSMGVEVNPVDGRNPEEIERAVASFARGPNGGLIVVQSGSTTTNRDFIIAMAERHRLPSIYPNRPFVARGGLISYGPDTIDPFRRAAGYVDRILKGEKPADLPVQAPMKYELIINLKTAKALGLEMRTDLLVRADEVIE